MTYTGADTSSATTVGGNGTGDTNVHLFTGVEGLEDTVTERGNFFPCVNVLTDTSPRHHVIKDN